MLDLPPPGSSLPFPHYIRTDAPHPSFQHSLLGTNSETDLKHQHAQDHIDVKYPPLHPDPHIGKQTTNFFTLPPVSENPNAAANDTAMSALDYLVAEGLQRQPGDDEEEEDVFAFSLPPLALPAPAQPTSSSAPLPPVDEADSAQAKSKPKPKKRAASTTKRKRKCISVGADTEAGTSTSVTVDEEIKALLDDPAADKGPKPKKRKAAPRKSRSASGASTAAQAQAQPKNEGGESKSPSVPAPIKLKGKGKGRAGGRKSEVEDKQDVTGTPTLAESVKLGLGGKGLGVPTINGQTAHSGSGMLDFHVQGSSACLAAASSTNADPTAPAEARPSSRPVTADQERPKLTFWRDERAVSPNETIETPVDIVTAHDADFSGPAEHSETPIPDANNNFVTPDPQQRGFFIAENRMLQLIADSKWSWAAMNGANKLFDTLLSPISTHVVAASMARLCGRYSDEPLSVHLGEPTFGTLLHNLAYAVHVPAPPINALSVDPGMEAIFARSIFVMTSLFCATKPIVHFPLSVDGAIRCATFSPPDVLWAFVHLADPVFFRPLLAALRMLYDAAPITQRGIVLTLLIDRLKYYKLTIAPGGRTWANELGRKMERNGLMLSNGDGLLRVSLQEIDAALRHYQAMYYYPLEVMATQAQMGRYGTNETNGTNGTMQNNGF